LLLLVVVKKLKVVNWPVNVVQYCKHPGGGLLGLLHVIWVTLISKFLVVLVEVEKVKARVDVSVAWLPMSM